MEDIKQDLIRTVGPEKALQIVEYTTAIEARAGSVIVTDNETLQQCDQIILDCAKAIKAGAAAIKPAKDAAKAAHSAICDLEKRMIAPFEAARAMAESKRKPYVIEQERIRQERERELQRIADEKAAAERREKERLRREAEERERKQREEAERQRKAAEAARIAAQNAKNEEERKAAEQRAKEAEAEAKRKQAQADANAQRAEEHAQAEAVVVAPVIAVASTVAGAKGISQRKKYKVASVDLPVFIAAAVSNPMLQGVIEINAGALARMKNANEKFEAPGVKWDIENIISARAAA